MAKKTGEIHFVNKIKSFCDRIEFYNIKDERDNAISTFEEAKTFYMDSLYKNNMGAWKLMEEQSNLLKIAGVPKPIDKRTLKKLKRFSGTIVVGGIGFIGIKGGCFRMGTNSGMEQTMEKINFLLEQVQKEAKTLKQQSRLVVDIEAHRIASKAYYNNEQTRQKLLRMKKIVKSSNQGHKIYTKTRSDIIASNDTRIKKNQKESDMRNISIGKSTTLKERIKDHAKTTDMLRSETEAIFKMMSPGSSTSIGDDEKPVHIVCVSSFWMGKYEVTQGQYKHILNSRPWSGKKYVQKGDNYPAVYVTWHDAKEFAEKFSQLYNVKARFPYEAEWGNTLPGQELRQCTVSAITIID